MSNYDFYKDDKSSSNNNTTQVKMIPKYVVVIVMVLVMACLLIAGVFIGVNINSVSGDGKELLKNMPALEEIYKLIDKYYYEEISWKELEDQVAAALAGVDNFSGIHRTENRSPFSIGFTVQSNLYNEAVLTNIVKDSPADLTDNGKHVSVVIDPITKEVTYETLPSNQNESSTKLQRGDKLIALRNLDVPNSKFISLDGLQFEVATALLSDCMHLELIVQKYDGYNMIFELTKSLITAPVSDYKYLGDGIGYIELTEFDASSIDQIYDTFYQFINDTRAQKLVFDLRNNGGGNLQLLQWMAEFFVNKKGEKLPICKFILKNGSEEVDYALEYTDAKGRKSQYFGANKSNYELAVLVNGGSASASETFLGMIRYYQPNTVVVGSPTYGKGVGQYVFENIAGKYTISMTAGKFYVPIDDNGSMAWKNYHTIPMLPDYNFLDADKANRLYSIVMPNIANEVDVAKAIELLLN